LAACITQITAADIDRFGHVVIIHSSFPKINVREMINKIIDQIKESEERAGGIIAGSKKESAKIIEKAYQEADSRIGKAELEAKRLSEEAGSKAKEDVKAEKKKLEEKYDKKIRSILENSRRKEEKAIKMIVDKVLE